MTSELVKSLEQEQIKPSEDLPELRAGDTVRLHILIVEGDRERVQTFQGEVLRIRGGGLNRTITVRRIGAHGVGVERTFPLHSPRLQSIEVLRHAHIRRARLYYLRERRGKSARLRERRWRQETASVGKGSAEVAEEAE